MQQQNLDAIMALDHEYYLNVFGERFSVCFVDGLDATLIDTTGKKYTDFLAGIAVCALGFAIPLPSIDTVIG